jgi:hypothetical protein
MASTAGRWAPVAAWIVVIYTTIPFVRRLREWFVARWDPQLISWGVAVTLVVLVLLAVAALRRRSTELRPGAFLWITVATAVLVLWTFSLRRSPEEAIHLVEYGILAAVIHRALRPAMPDVLIFVAAALLGAIVGTMDEVIQWFSPMRTWDWRDIVLNFGAGAITQLALWRALPGHAAPVSSRSLRIVLRIATVLVLLFTLCLANTPRRVARYAPLLPQSKHLTSSLNPMAEYGHLHVIPEIGSFKSRLELTAISDEDRKRAAEVAAALDASRHSYGEFLNTWPVAEDPFTYEVRVHLFARDRNLGRAREQGFEDARAREQLTVSRFENLLVEEIFPSTLEHSSYGWKPGLRRRVEAAHDPAFDFESAAGSHLITIASEGAIRILLLALAMLFLVADRSLKRYHRRPS